MAHAGGRPTKYRPEMCGKVVKMGKEGFSLCEMASDLEIAWDTFERWRKEKPEFSDAVKQALRNSQAWWERKGREATFGECQGFNATSYIFQMKNRFSDDWREKQEIEHKGGISVVQAEPEDADI